MDPADTPRTNAKAVTFESGFPVLNCAQVVNADFARTLERENAKLRDGLTLIANGAESATAIAKLTLCEASAS